MKRARWIGVALGIVALVGLVAPVPTATAQGGVKVGFLSCNVSSGWGLIFGSSRDVNCTFSPSSSGAPGKEERYKGKIMKFGADIGYMHAAVMVWGVFSPASDIKAGALAGQYAGATGSATVGVGVGANVLVGGFNKSITLQPVSLEGQTGLNVAAGIGALTLESAR
ncbi:MAG TPA: DUF992 domain-containing protein [Candidatus Methylomirabilis sp.]|jgi:hypothetical protein